MRQRSSWSVRAIGSAQFQWCWTHGRGRHTVIDRMTGRRRNKFDAAVGINVERWRARRRLAAEARFEQRPSEKIEIARFRPTHCREQGETCDIGIRSEEHTSELKSLIRIT